MVSNWPLHHLDFASRMDKLLFVLQRIFTKLLIRSCEIFIVENQKKKKKLNKYIMFFPCSSKMSNMIQLLYN